MTIRRRKTAWRRRTRRDRLRDRLTVAVTLLLVGATAAGAHRLRESFPDLAAKLPLEVREVTFSGMASLAAEDLRVAAGVKAGDPLFGPWMGTLVRSLKENPRVADVSVFRGASGTVHVRVRERTPKALVNFDVLYYLGGEGEVLEVADAHAADRLDWVVVTGPWSGKQKCGSWSAELGEAAGILGDLRRAGLAPESVSELHLDEDLGWVVVPVGPARAILGREDFERRAVRLVRVLKDLRDRGARAREIDLDFAHRVVVKVKQET